jgi:WD40 repeat protein
VPAGLVSSYRGASSYLLLDKYNNYAGLGTGDGTNRMAILDPNNTETDPISGNLVMSEVMTLLGQTPDPVAIAQGFPHAVKEWCVNAAAVDPNTNSVFVNSEDGILYRWNLSTGQISQKIWLDNGYGQAYTPTAIGPDGAVYSINNATLIAVKQ